MKERLVKLLTTYSSTIGLLIVYALIMGVATIVEKYLGSEEAKTLFYFSPVMIILQALIAANIVGVTLKHHLLKKKRLGYLTIHFSFLIILIGAAVTHYLSSEGLMHIREGRTADTFKMNTELGQNEHKLPFKVKLLDFRMKRYPGSESPSSYESDIVIIKEGEEYPFSIYMNNIVDMDGYRLFQASYDKDEKGTVLMVSYDEVGRNITYFGYFILLIGFIIMFFEKSSRFGILRRQLKESNKFALSLLLLMFPFAGIDAQNSIKEQADKFGDLPCQMPNGRIAPVSTVSSQLVRKIVGKGKYKTVSANEVVLGILLFPSEWVHTPLLLVDDKEIVKRYDLRSKQVSYMDMFDANGDYKLRSEINSVYNKPIDKRTKYDKDLMKLDERVNALHSLFKAQRVRIFPDGKDEKNHKWYAIGERQMMNDSLAESQVITLFSKYREAIGKGRATGEFQDADKALNDIVNYQKENLAGLDIDYDKIRLESSYDKGNYISWVKVGYLSSGGLMLILILVAWSRKERTEWVRRIATLFFGIVSVAVLVHIALLGIRWYISGYAPWSNSYETMVSLSAAVVLGGLYLYFKNKLVFALSSIFGGVILFVSQLSWMDPQITPLVPVLKSPWLMFHVAVLIIAYGFMGIATMISTAYLVIRGSVNTMSDDLSERLKQLNIISEMALIIGVIMMSVGVFLGAVWANESWGRYWSWDPKETWALITTVIYATVLHYRWFYRKGSDIWYNIFTQWAFLTVIMTYFGVNYLLSGMHSYGSNDGLSLIPWWVDALFISFFSVPAIMALRKK